MAGFTRQASSVSVPNAPQLQTNTGSTVGDIVSAASFGVGLLDRNRAMQAQEAARASAEADVLAQKEAVINLDQGSEAVLAFRNSQNLTGVALENAVNDFTMGEASRRGLLTGALRTQVAKFSGGSIIQRRDAARTAEQAAVAAEEIKLVKAQKESAALDNAASLLQGWSDSTYDGNTPDSEKRVWINSAQANKSIHDVAVDKLKLRQGEATNDETNRSFNVKLYGVTTASVGVNSTIQQVKRLIGDKDVLTPSENLEVRGLLDATLASYRANIGSDAINKKGLVLSQDDINGLTDNFSKLLEPLYNGLDTDQNVKLLTAKMDLIGLHMFNTPNPTPAEFNAMLGISVSKITRNPSLAQGVLSALQGAAAGMNSNERVSAVAQSVQEIAVDAKLTATQAIQAQEFALQRHFDTMSPSTKETHPVAQDLNFDKIMTVLTGTNKSIEEDVALSWNIILEKFSGENAHTLISDENKNEVLHTFAVPAQRVITGSLETIMQTPQFVPTSKILGAGAAGAGAGLLLTQGGQPQDTEFTHAFDKETLEFYPITPKGVRASATQDIRDYNQIIQRTIKAYEALGATDTQMTNLRDDIYNGIIMFDRSRIKEINAEEKKDD